MAFWMVWVILLVAAWIYMTGWFLLARRLQRTDVIDVAWGLGFVVVAWLAWLLEARRADYRLLTAVLITVWGLRLAVHIGLRNRHKSEDHRYVLYRDKWGQAYWRQAYRRIFLLQGVLLLGISSTGVAIMRSQYMAARWLAVLGFAVWLFGIAFEAEADRELQRFVRRKQPGEIMTNGLWRYSRHPNYFGEVTTWWGAGLVAVSAKEWWGILGTIVITALITKISGIPPLEKHYDGNEAFEAYKQQTSVFIPLPPRKS
jgi:steroid 5-alpha reductase family enzyme